MHEAEAALAEIRDHGRTESALQGRRNLNQMLFYVTLSLPSIDFRQHEGLLEVHFGATLPIPRKKENGAALETQSWQFP